MKIFKAAISSYRASEIPINIISYDKTATVTYAVVDEDVDDISLIGALYGKDGKLVEIKTVPVANVEKNYCLSDPEVVSKAIELENICGC